jgi:phosphate butyryltransferase
MRTTLMNSDDVDLLENRTFGELAVGDSASIVRTVTATDVQLFAAVTGDLNPAHLDPAFAATDIFHRVIVHGMWGAGLISSALGVKLPGPGTIYLDQSLDFVRPVNVGDTITATVTVIEKRPEHQVVILDCRCVSQRDEVVITGRATVKAPTEKVRWPRPSLPDVLVSAHSRYRALVGAAKGGMPIPTAVVHPCDAAAMIAVSEAAGLGLISPFLVGPEQKIRSAAEAAGTDISAFRIVPAPHSHAAAARAVELARSAEVQMLMKGSLHTDELMSAVVPDDTGLRTERRISHVYLLDVPAYPRPLLITDAAINIAPDLEAKRDIIQNAIELAKVIGIATPKVAILSAVETVTAKLPSTLHAAALCKMADRGQISGGVLDGPLAFDNAISPAAAREKGIVSPVAGQADILVVPDLEAGNMLAKQLTFLAGADAAGIVLGARVPIILTSRADSERTRVASCALAVLVARARIGAAPGGPAPAP